MEPPAGDRKKQPITVITDVAHLRQQLELMHDRCIANNLRAAGLGTIGLGTLEKPDDDELYGELNANATMADGEQESMLMAVLNRIEGHEKKARYVSILMIEGANVNEQTAERRLTPLMFSVIHGYEKCFKVLCNQARYLNHPNSQRNVDHSRADVDGNTLLHHLASVGSITMLKTYLKSLRKADSRRYGYVPEENFSRSVYDNLFEAVNNDLETPQRIALKHASHECATLMQEEQLRQLNKMDRTLSLVQHVTTPAMARKSVETGKRVLKRLASFDSLRLDSQHRGRNGSGTQFHNYGFSGAAVADGPDILTLDHGRGGGGGLMSDDDEDDELFQESTNFSRQISRIKHDLKYGSSHDFKYEETTSTSLTASLSSSQLRHELLSDTGLGGGSSDRPNYVLSKSEFLRSFPAAASNHSKLARSRTTTGGPITAFPFDIAKQKMGDKLRSLTINSDNPPAKRNANAEPNIGGGGGEKRWRLQRQQSLDNLLAAFGGSDQRTHSPAAYQPFGGANDLAPPMASATTTTHPLKPTTALSRPPTARERVRQISLPPIRKQSEKGEKRFVDFSDIDID